MSSSACAGMDARAARRPSGRPGCARGSTPAAALARRRCRRNSRARTRRCRSPWDAPPAPRSSPAAGTGSSPALCGWMPTVHQTCSGAAPPARSRCGDWPSRVPIVTISPTPASAARASTVGTLGGLEIVEMAMRIDQHQARYAASSTKRGKMPCGAGSVGPGRQSPAEMRRSCAGPAGTPSWSSIRAMLPGMNGCSTVATSRSASASTRSTAAMRAGSVLRSAQGACRSI